MAALVFYPIFKYISAGIPGISLGSRMQHIDY